MIFKKSLVNLIHKGDLTLSSVAPGIFKRSKSRGGDSGSETEGSVSGCTISDAPTPISRTNSVPNMPLGRAGADKGKSKSISEERELPAAKLQGKHSRSMSVITVGVSSPVVNNMVVSRCESVVYGANSPVEDRIVVHNDGTGGFYGVFDGHGGVEASDYTCENVEKLFRKEVTSSAKKVGGKTENKCEHAKRIRSCLHSAFIKTDMAFKTALHVDAAHPKRATVGTCALASFIENGTLYVANAGDSRAVIGRRGYNNKITAVAMSEDHNANQPREQRRLIYEHPDEVDLLEPRGNTLYVKGCLQTTRSIGDFYLKDPFCNSCLESPVPLLSPPYVSSEAQVFTYDLSKCDEFMVLASDGLWDYLSNDEVVSFISTHADKPDVCRRLKDVVLSRSAAEHNTTVGDIRSVPLGSERRKLHDDISIIVLYFACSAVTSP